MTFEVLADPIPLSRPRFSKGRAYLPERSRKYREAVQSVARQVLTSQDFSFKEEISCQLKFYRRFKPTSRRFGDLDNLIKAVLDSLQGLLFDDDAAVTKITAEKLQDNQSPRVEITLETKNTGKL